MVYLLLFTVRSHYFALSILSLLTLEIDFPIFNRRSSFYGLLKIVPKHDGIRSLGIRGWKRGYLDVSAVDKHILVRS